MHLSGAHSHFGDSHSVGGQALTEPNIVVGATCVNSEVHTCKDADSRPSSCTNTRRTIG
jgi:hypothetical protein